MSVKCLAAFSFSSGVPCACRRARAGGWVKNDHKADAAPCMKTHLVWMVLESKLAVCTLQLIRTGRLWHAEQIVIVPGVHELAPVQHAQGSRDKQQAPHAVVCDPVRTGRNWQQLSWAGCSGPSEIASHKPPNWEANNAAV